MKPKPDQPSPSRPSTQRRAFWTKQFYAWHWISSAICLASMLFFAITGITLNHAGRITAQPAVTPSSAILPPHLIKLIAPEENEVDDSRKPLPRELRHWLDAELDTQIGGRSYEWSPVDIYVDLPRPGGDGWLSIDRLSGEVEQEVTRRGWIAYLNDLHKGRDTGFEWILFMDLFSVASIVFCLTGLALLVVHARRRPSTWPIVIAGIALPIFVLILFVHT